MGSTLRSPPHGVFLCPFTCYSWLEQLENLVYYNRLKNSKIVISDFHLAKLENGLIKEPCGTPEYLGKQGWGKGAGAGRERAFKEWLWVGGKELPRKWV